MFIYKITNKINGKIYIGQTIRSVGERFFEHSNKTKSKKSILSSAIQKYGKEKFKIEEIDGANSLSELNYLETHYIYKFNTLAPNGYNIEQGGFNNTLSKDYKKERLSNKRNPIVDTTTGKIFNNEHVLCEKFGIKLSTLRAHLGGINKTCKGRVFVYLDKWNNVIITDIKSKSSGKSHYLTYAIVDITTGRKYETIKEASKELNIPVSSINYNINGKSKTCHNRKFVKSIDWDGKITGKISRENKRARKKIVEINSNIVYNSIKEAAKKIGCKEQSITDNLSRRTKTVKRKYRFKYV